MNILERLVNPFRKKTIFIINSSFVTEINVHPFKGISSEMRPRRLAQLAGKSCDMILWDEYVKIDWKKVKKQKI